MAYIPTEAVVGTTIAFSYILLGNAITQSFMGVPALLVDFPSPSSPEHASRAKLLGRQWPVFWAVGNVFFRPISTFGIFGYGYTAWVAASYSQEWRPFALAAACHLVTVLHSAMNMQPLNNKLDALREEPKSGADGSVRVEAREAEGLARRWIRYNGVRIAMPFIAGTVALFELLKSR